MLKIFRIFNFRLSESRVTKRALSDVEIHRHKRQHELELSGEELQKHEEEEALKETARGNSSGLEEVSSFPI